MSVDLSDYIEIPVYRRGLLFGMAKVDREDYPNLIGRLWRTHNGYAVHRVGNGVEFMHRVILGLPAGVGMTDHINRDRLDNRRVNLRVVTQAANNQNVSPRKGGTSAHRDVSWCSARGMWLARVCVNGRIYEELHEREWAAAHAANRLREKYMPYSEEAAA
jgi:hypothetical protein